MGEPVYISMSGGAPYGDLDLNSSGDKAVKVARSRSKDKHLPRKKKLNRLTEAGSRIRKVTKTASALFQESHKEDPRAT